jgi:hypothetical protein
MTHLTFDTAQGMRAIRVVQTVVAGWTGRDRAAVEHHIAELAALGVAPPSSVPTYYRVASNLLTQDDTIQVVGEETSGEAEPVLIDDGGTLWLTVGSDHTDRALEAHSVALSKQVCAKPVARAAWALDEVRDHLDLLELRSWIAEDGSDWRLYQEGTLAAIRPLPELIADNPCQAGSGRLAPGTAMMCGTLSAQGGVRPASRFRMELRDPVHDRFLEAVYAVEALPAVS